MHLQGTEKNGVRILAYSFSGLLKKPFPFSRAVRGQGNPETAKLWLARLLQSTLGNAVQIWKRLRKAAAHAKADLLVLTQPWPNHCSIWTCQLVCSARHKLCSVTLELTPLPEPGDAATSHLHVPGLVGGHTAVSVLSCPRTELLSCGFCGVFALCIPCF